MEPGTYVKVVSDGDPQHLSTKLEGHVGVITEDGRSKDGLLEVEFASAEPNGQPVRHWFAPSCLKRRRFRTDADDLLL